jgi:hypothetical protein
VIGPLLSLSLFLSFSLSSSFFSFSLSLSSSFFSFFLCYCYCWQTTTATKPTKSRHCLEKGSDFLVETLRAVLLKVDEALTEPTVRQHDARIASHHREGRHDSIWWQHGTGQQDASILQNTATADHTIVRHDDVIADPRGFYDDVTPNQDVRANAHGQEGKGPLILFAGRSNQGTDAEETKQTDPQRGQIASDQARIRNNRLFVIPSPSTTGFFPHHHQ